MVALPLFDVVLSSGSTPERAREVAVQLVQASLSELSQIQNLEQRALPRDPTAFDRPTAALLRGLYETWAHEAESLMDRISSMKERGEAVDGYVTLRDAYGRVRAMLSVSLDSIERGLKDIAEGRTLTAEEVRRELRLRAG